MGAPHNTSAHTRMKLTRCPVWSVRAVAWLAVLAISWGLAGCQQVFRPKHRVIVDAIAAPGVTKPGGKSYKLVAKRSVVSNMPVQVPVLKACVDAALGGQGMYEAPPNVPPEIVIEVTYGRDNSPRALAAVRETYLQLSARSNPQRSLDKATGPELWDVRTAVLGVSGAIETALPLLSAVAAEHMATNTLVETRIEVPQDSPMIENVRLAAIRALESQAQRVAAAQGNAATNGAGASVVTPPAATSATPARSGPPPILEKLPPPPAPEPTPDEDAPPENARFRPPPDESAESASTKPETNG